VIPKLLVKEIGLEYHAFVNFAKESLSLVNEKAMNIKK